ncbi:MAG: DNA-formamidopyrimidine glycosylase family protein [bacterium]
MPELPEITCRAREMNEALVGKTIASIEIGQPKCLNVPARTFAASLAGARLLEVTNRGKWIFVETTRGWLLINMGMGGEILLVRSKSLPAKRRVVFKFKDGAALSLNFWWFGYIHFVRPGKLDGHAMTAVLGPNATDISAEELWAMIEGRRGRVKTLLLDQSRLAGIGNAYVHDILFLAGLHPLESLSNLDEDDARRLAQAIRDGLVPSIKKGGAFYELNLHGKKGGFLKKHILVGYRPGEPCPVCDTAIVKIRTGGTASFICPRCQALRKARKRLKSQNRGGA